MELLKLIIILLCFITILNGGWFLYTLVYWRFVKKQDSNRSIAAAFMVAVVCTSVLITLADIPYGKLPHTYSKIAQVIMILTVILSYLAALRLYLKTRPTKPTFPPTS